MIINFGQSDLIEKYKGCTLTYGHFNTIHPGHIRYLKYAKNLGSDLVIALIGDKDCEYFPFSQTERGDALELLGIADAIVYLESFDLFELLNTLKPSTLVLGNEHQNNKNLISSIDLQEKSGRSVQFHTGDIHYASSELLLDNQQDIFRKRKFQFLNACKRQHIKLDQLLHSIDRWKENRLIVLGDTIVDQYAACEALGMSAEAPVVVVRELQNKNFIGGAAIVASHIKSLGAHCDLISVVGDDETSKLVRNVIKSQKIGDGLITDTNRPTTFKKRYVVENQKLFRVTRLEDKNLSSEIENKVISKLEELAPKANGIVISDFVYGVVTSKILKFLEELTQKYDIKLFGDLQCSSQVGSVLRFQKFHLLCPNEREARIALQDKDSGLEQLSRKMLDLTKSKRLVMKLGSDGFVVYDRLGSNSISSQSFPALSVNPIDVTGAGDSLLALMSISLSIGQPLMPTAALASCIASIAVERMGNVSIDADTLRNKIKEIMK